MIRVLQAAARRVIPLEGVGASLAADLREVRAYGPRARQATITALAVMIASTLAMAGHMDMPWWAALSGFMSVQATRPGSWQRATLRIIGTATGAAAALLVLPFIVDDHVAGSLCLLAAAAIGILGCLVSPHAYAWLFFGITTNLVILLSINQPAMALHFAFYRTFEVAIGSVTALLVVLALAPDGAAAPVPAAAGWSDLLGKGWPAVVHALRTGFAVMLLPWTWSFFELPALSQTAITVAAVMSVPVLTDHPMEQGRKIAGRAAQRALGCFIGGIIALAVLAFSVNEFLPWLLLLAGGTWFGAYMQTSERGVGYVGTQATVVYLMMVVQGWGPPTSILPGVNRFAGITLGVVILTILSLLFWPAEHPAEPQGSG
jgi:uncharacterized membrane protein YccC